MLFNKKTNSQPDLPVEQKTDFSDWMESATMGIEGQLSIDVYQTGEQIVVKSTIAGVRPEDLKISLHHDLLTIKGSRQTNQEIKEDEYLYKECYWGSFSRSIILPAQVDEKRVEAELENGVLTVTLYKSDPNKIEVKVKE